MRKRPLFLCACVFLAGLVCCRYHRAELIGFLVLWLLYEWFCGIRHHRIKIAAGRSIALLSAFILGNTHMLSEMSFREAYLSKIEDGDEVTVWGEITKLESIATVQWDSTETTSFRLYLSDCYISLNEAYLPCNNVMVYTSSNQYQVGQIHTITGELHMFEKAANEGGFDSRTYYQSQKIDFCVYEEKSQLLDAGANWLRDEILSLKNAMQQVYERCVPEKTAGFLEGMVIGDRGNLDAEVKALFTDGGIAHILAISGLHVSIIGRGLYNVIRNRGINFKLAGFLAGTLLMGYCYMVGSGMSAVRAVGMMLIFFGAQILGKSYDMLNSLGAMVLYLLWENPFLLEYSGFWFSILALIGVGFVGDVFSKTVTRGRGFLMSVGITLTTLPVVAYCYYEIPLYAPLVNFLLLPILTPIFVLALAGGFIGLILPEAASVILLPCQWGLVLYEWVCQLVGRFPFAIIITGQPAWEVIVGYYVVLIVGTLCLRKIILLRQLQEECQSVEEKALVRKRRRRELGTLFGLCVICFLLIVYPKPQKAEITFLDVGQGEGIYICTGDGCSYFIDGGSVSEKNLGEYCLLPFFKSNDIEQIDYWFVSHADMDHISGLLEVLESGFSIRNLVVAEGAPRDDNLENVLEAARVKSVQVLFMETGDCLKTKGTSLTCLYPRANEAEDNPEILEDRNEASLVLELCFTEFGGVQDFRAVFSGDISSEIEQQLLERGKLEEVWLYKAAHHGSKYSNAWETMQILSPEAAVVSCGKNNRYGHPALTAIQNMQAVGAKIYYTMDAGQITIEGEERLNIYGKTEYERED